MFIIADGIWCDVGKEKVYECLISATIEVEMDKKKKHMQNSNMYALKEGSQP